MRFRFQFPSLVKTALAEAEVAPANERVKAIIRAVLLGFPARLQGIRRPAKQGTCDLVFEPDNERTDDSISVILAPS
jgi:hypothetical protein